MLLLDSLSGIRSVRAPLLAGYLWLFFAYLTAGDEITNPPTHGVVHQIGMLIDTLGLAVSLGALTVCAYLVGCVSHALTLFIFREVAALAREGEVEQIEAGAVARYLDSQGGASGAVPAELDRKLKIEAQQARFRLKAELGQRSVLMTGKASGELLTEIDRLKAEAQFRLDAVLPLLALSIYLGVNHSSWWFGALGGVFLLARQGVEHEIELKGLIDAGFGPDDTASSAIARYRRALEKLEANNWELSAEDRLSMQRFQEYEFRSAGPPADGRAAATPLQQGEPPSKR